MLFCIGLLFPVCFLGLRIGGKFLLAINPKSGISKVKPLAALILFSKIHVIFFKTFVFVLSNIGFPFSKAFFPVVNYKSPDLLLPST